MISAHEALARLREVNRRVVDFFDGVPSAVK